jgi:hypothetical protein
LPNSAIVSNSSHFSGDIDSTYEKVGTTRDECHKVNIHAAVRRKRDSFLSYGFDEEPIGVEHGARTPRLSDSCGSSQLRPQCCSTVVQTILIYKRSTDSHEHFKSYSIFPRKSHPTIDVDMSLPSVLSEADRQQFIEHGWVKYIVAPQLILIE